MSWPPLNLTVRVGCSLAYETPVPTAVLFVLWVGKLSVVGKRPHRTRMGSQPTLCFLECEH